MFITKLCSRSSERSLPHGFFPDRKDLRAAFSAVANVGGAAVTARAFDVGLMTLGVLRQFREPLDAFFVGSIARATRAGAALRMTIMVRGLDPEN
jgi:hypothetical protein